MTAAVNDTSITRNAEFAIDPIFTNRWSPRAFTGEAIDERILFTLFEAARWAPSANNSQPWRFIYCLKDSPKWPAFLGLLSNTNRRWAANASVLVVLVSKTTHIRNGDTEPTPLRSHSFDSGAAWALLALQAQHSGWRTHAMGGFNRDLAREVLSVPEGYDVEVAIAIGRQAEHGSLPPDLQERERPSQRKPLGKFVAEGRFAFVE
jgi:nitroreductase